MPGSWGKETDEVNFSKAVTDRNGLVHGNSVALRTVLCLVEELGPPTVKYRV